MINTIKYYKQNKFKTTIKRSLRSYHVEKSSVSKLVLRTLRLLGLFLLLMGSSFLGMSNGCELATIAVALALALAFLVRSSVILTWAFNPYLKLKKKVWVKSEIITIYRQIIP